MLLLVPWSERSVNDGDALNCVYLVKRSRALLGSNLTRDNRVRATEKSSPALSSLGGKALFMVVPVCSALPIFLEPSMP